MSIRRFIRNYELIITTPNRVTTIVKPPLKIAFQCLKSTGQGLNKLNINIWNLKKSNRLKIVKDKEQNINITIELKIGYQDIELETIFKGNVFYSSNVKEGADYISKLECLDGMFDYINSVTSVTVTSLDSGIDQILNTMPNTERGKITKLDDIQRPRVLIGNSYSLFDILKPKDSKFYIDNGQVFILKNDEVVTRFLPVVSSDTGLKDTPRRENQLVTFTSLMNPSLKLGSRCNVRSLVAPHLNGVYKIEAMNYTGDYDGKEWEQRVTAISSNTFKVL